MLTDGKTLVVLGGSGFIGRRVIGEAVAAGWNVKALARSEAAAEALAALGAMPFSGDAEEPGQWARELSGARAVVDLIQPKLPKRLDARTLRAISERRLRFTRTLVTELARLPEGGAPRLVSVSGIDDLAPDAEGRITERSALRMRDYGFSAIGIPVRRTIEASGVAATFCYLGVVYGPGKAFAETIFPSVAGGSWKNFARAGDLMNLIHVDDAARGIVHRCDEPVAGRTFVLVDGSPVTMADFFGEAAVLMGVAAPRSVPRWLAAMVAGRANVEAMAGPVTAPYDAANFPAGTLRYPSFRDGLPATLSALGYGRGSSS